MANSLTLSEAVIGLPLDNAELANLLTSLDPNAIWEDDDGQTDWVSHTLGVDVQGDTDSNEVSSVFYFNEGIEEHHMCSIDLPFGIDMTWVRSQVVAHLGEPNFAGPTHDSWHHPGFRYIVEYGKTDHILKASLTRA